MTAMPRDGAARSVVVLSSHGLRFARQRSIDDVSLMGSDFTTIYEPTADIVETLDYASEVFRETQGDDGVVVVATGAKADWRDALSRAEILQREFTRRVGIDAFSPKRSRRASLEVEGRGRDLPEQAKETARLLARRPLRSVTVVVSRSADRDAVRSAFRGALPDVDLFVRAPTGDGANAAAVAADDRPAKRARR